MSEWIRSGLSGIVGAVIAAMVAIFLWWKSQKRPSGLAYELMKKFRKRLKDFEGEYWTVDSTQGNYEVANRIYSDANADIIATAFTEDPAVYNTDIARAFGKYGNRFTRVTCSDVCPPESESKTLARMQKELRGSQLCVVPASDKITKIDGIFCHFDDDTYLAFFSFHHPGDVTRNRGVVFRDGIAELLFTYYHEIAREYGTN